MNLIKLTIVLFFNFLIFNCFSQTTINKKDKVERETSTTHKVMLIPFEPRLYLSEIDYNINAETKLTAKQIKHTFRDGLNDQLYKAFKTEKYGVVDLMEDTTKYKKDMEGIYQYLSFDYQKVPNQDNYQAPKKEKDKKQVEKGQLNVETNTEARFMNAKVTNAKVVPLLYAKYKTDIFVFINQLEIKAMGSKGPAELGEGNANRKIIVHYTVYTFDAKEINSGIAEQEFESTLNNPKKIIEKYISKIANVIATRVTKALVVK